MIYSIPRQQKLENQLHLFSKAFNETQAISKIGSWDWDLETNEVRWSDMMYILMGLQPNESIPSYGLALSHVHVDDKDEFEHIVEQAKNKKTSFQLENRISKKCGSVIPVISRGECILDEKGRVIRMAGSIQDITDRKELEKLIKEKHAAEDRDRIKSTILTVIAHDLKSPFLSLNYLSDVIIEEIEKNDQKKSIEYVHHIKNITKQTYDLLVNLLDWSLSQTDKISFNPVMTNLAILTEEQIAFFQPVSDEKKVALTSAVEPHIEVLCDKNMMITIMRNLIHNALIFNKIDGSVSVHATRNEDDTTISIVDNGIGIPPDVLDSFFKKDKIISKKGTADHQGTGLGLSLCKEFIHKHQGEIWVESEEGKGSVFYFTLPNNQN